MSKITILIDDNLINSDLYNHKYNKYLQKVYYKTINKIVIALSNYYKQININFLNSSRIELENKVLDSFDISKHILNYNSNLTIYDGICNIINVDNKKIIVFTYNQKNLDLIENYENIKIIFMDLINIESLSINTYSFILETLTPKKALHYNSTIEYYVETQLAEVLI